MLVIFILHKGQPHCLRTKRGLLGRVFEENLIINGLPFTSELQIGVIDEMIPWLHQVFFLAFPMMHTFSLLRPPFITMPSLFFPCLSCHPLFPPLSSTQTSYQGQIGLAPPTNTSMFEFPLSEIFNQNGTYKNFGLCLGGRPGILEIGLDVTKFPEATWVPYQGTNFGYGGMPCHLCHLPSPSTSPSASPSAFRLPSSIQPLISSLS